MFYRKEMESKIDSFNDKGEIANFILKNVRELLNEDNLAINEVLDIFSSEKFPKELFYDAKFMGELANMSKYSVYLTYLISNIRTYVISSNLNDQLKFSLSLASTEQGSRFFNEYSLIFGKDNEEISKQFIDETLTAEQRETLVELLGQLAIRDPGLVFDLPAMNVDHAAFDKDFYKSVIHKANEIPPEELSAPERAVSAGLVALEMEYLQKERERLSKRANNSEKVLGER